jgi:hypothetical protein
MGDEGMGDDGIGDEGIGDEGMGCIDPPPPDGPCWANTGAAAVVAMPASRPAVTLMAKILDMG